MKTISIIMTGMILSVGMSGVIFAQDKVMMEHKMMGKPGMAMERMSDHGKYAEYTPSAFDAAKDKKRVLFFAAKWCPTCMATDKALKGKGANIPVGLQVFKADYDSSTDLKAKYGVTHMDTFVQVDKDGQKIALWNGGGVDGLTKNLK